MNYTVKHEGTRCYTWPTLYKTASKGKEQQWDICVCREEEGQPEKADIVVRHGQVGGKIQHSITKVTQGKNLGKANATTFEQQAVSEAEAKWVKQQDKGYSTERGGGSMELKPMLAHSYEDVKEKIGFPAHIQPKLDGCRCIAYRESEETIRLISRQNKDFGKWLDHIRQALSHMMKVGEIFDGELYVHGVPFQKVISWIKKDQPDTKNVEYHVYDMVSDSPFIERLTYAANRIKAAGASATSALTDHIRVVSTYSVDNHEDVQEAHEKFVTAGYEGAILRVGECSYKQGYRSRELLKVKAFKDAEFEIIDVIEGKGKFEGRAIFRCKTEAGAEFEATPKGRDELRQRYFAERDNLIGKKLTVKFFEWTSSDNPVPRFPVAIAVRDYE